MDPTTSARSSAGPIRVVVVDDHEMLAASLAHVLDAEQDLECVGVAHTLEGARHLVGTGAPDVLLLAHRLPDGDGVGAIREMRSLRPGLAVVVLTASAADQVLVRAVEAGAAGFLSKSRSIEEVIATVRAAASGEVLIPSDVLARLLPRLSRPGTSRHQELTQRECEVLGLLATGLTNAAIADRLFISVHTVRNHVANLTTKLGAHSKLEALSIAMRDGLLPEA